MLRVSRMPLFPLIVARERMSRADALRELRRCAGAQFDPEIVETFCALLTPAKRPQARFSPATQRAH